MAPAAAAYRPFCKGDSGDAGVAQVLGTIKAATATPAMRSPRNQTPFVRIGSSRRWEPGGARAACFAARLRPSNADASVRAPVAGHHLLLHSSGGTALRRWPCSRSRWGQRALIRRVDEAERLLNPDEHGILRFRERLRRRRCTTGSSPLVPAGPRLRPYASRIADLMASLARTAERCRRTARRRESGDWGLNIRSIRGKVVLLDRFGEVSASPPDICGDSCPQFRAPDRMHIRN